MLSPKTLWMSGLTARLSSASVQSAMLPLPPWYTSGVMSSAVGGGGVAAGSTSRAAGAVHVVGSGVVVWPRVGVRTAPNMRAPIVVTLTEFGEDYRPRPVLALAARRNASGHALWYRISIPGRPNGRSGWVPASSIQVK